MTDDFDPFTPMFSQRDAVMLTQADNDTIDNWVRYKHVLPVRIGNRRLFSFFDLLAIDLTWTLAKTFRAEIHAASFVAKTAAKEYLDDVEVDRAEIERGGSWSALSGNRGDQTFSLIRDENGDLRATERGDLDVDDVMIVLPVRLIARRLLAALKIWAEREPA